MGNDNSSTRKIATGRVAIDTDSGLSIRYMKPSDVPKVKEIVEFYLTEEQKKDEKYTYYYSLSYIPCTFIVLDSQPGDDKGKMEESGSKESKSENQKFVYRQLTSTVDNRPLLEKKQETVVGFLQYYMKKRSDEELKEIKVAIEKGWLKSPSLPESVAAISAIYIIPSCQSKNLEIYDKVIDMVKRILKRATEPDKINVFDTLDCEIVSTTSESDLIETAKTISLLQKKGFKILHVNDEKTYYRFRCLL